MSFINASLLGFMSDLTIFLFLISLAKIHIWSNCLLFLLRYRVMDIK